MKLENYSTIKCTCVEDFALPPSEIAICWGSTLATSLLVLDVYKYQKSEARSLLSVSPSELAVGNTPNVLPY